MDRNEIDLEAYRALRTAEKKYLIANGWDQVGPGEWDEPHERDRCLTHDHAVNSQKARDRRAIYLTAIFDHEGVEG